MVFRGWPLEALENSDTPEPSPAGAAWQILAASPGR